MSKIVVLAEDMLSAADWKCAHGDHPVGNRGVRLHVEGYAVLWLCLPCARQLAVKLGQESGLLSVTEVQS